MFFNKTIKPLIIILILFLTGLSLAGCTKDEAPLPAAEAEAAATPAPTAATPTPIPVLNEASLRVMFAGSPADAQKINEKFNAELKKYLTNTVVNIDFIPPGDYEAKLGSVLASGETVDLANLNRGAGSQTDILAAEAGKGTLLALDGLLAGVPEVYAVVPEAAWSRAKVSGQIYMVPLVFDMTDGFFGLKTRRESAEKYGFIDEIKPALEYDNDPVTDEVYEIITSYLTTLKAGGELRGGADAETLKNLPMKAYYGMESSSSFVAYKNEESGCRVVNYYEQPEVKTMYAYLADWRSSGLIGETAQNAEESCILFMGPQNLSDPFYPEFDSDIIDSADFGFDAATVAWGANYFISPPADYGQGYIIPKTAEDPVRALELAYHINASAGLWDILADGGDGANYGMDFLRWPPEKRTEEYIGYVREVKMDFGCIVTPVANFHFDSGPVDEKLSAFLAVRGEYEPRLASGAEPDWESVYDEMIFKMKEAGADEIIAELQNRADEYLETNPPY